MLPVHVVTSIGWFGAFYHISTRCVVSKTFVNEFLKMVLITKWINSLCLFQWGRYGILPEKIGHQRKHNNTYN